MYENIVAGTIAGWLNDFLRDGTETKYILCLDQNGNYRAAMIVTIGQTASTCQRGGRVLRFALTGLLHACRGETGEWSQSVATELGSPMANATGSAHFFRGVFFPGSPGSPMPLFFVRPVSAARHFLLSLWSSPASEMRHGRPERKRRVSASTQLQQRLRRNSGKLYSGKRHI